MPLAAPAAAPVSDAVSTVPAAPLAATEPTAAAPVQEPASAGLPDEAPAVTLTAITSNDTGSSESSTQDTADTLSSSGAVSARMCTVMYFEPSRALA